MARFRLASIDMLIAFATCLVVSGALLGMATPAFADGYDDAYAKSCVNGGSGNTTCVTSTPPGSCTSATSGKQCDKDISCKCVVNSGGICKCA